MDRFEAFKTSVMDSCTDHSPKGSMDVAVVGLCAKINGLSNYVTLSSCSGRMSVWCEQIPSTVGSANWRSKGKAGGWLQVSHSEVLVAGLYNECELYETLFPGLKVQRSSDDESDLNLETLVSVKFEPLILHIGCRTLDAAQKMLKTVLEAGCRNSGLVPSTHSRWVCQVRTSVKVDVPVGSLRLCEDTKTDVVDLVVNRAYLKNLLRLVNRKFGENEARRMILEERIQKVFLSGTASDDSGGVVVESKDQRRSRKRQLGLELQKLSQLGDVDGGVYVDVPGSGGYVGPVGGPLGMAVDLTVLNR